MSTCVLTGFAKQKKYVGTIYACNGSDLPATQDFGTVQFSGPFESAQAIPVTTIDYTIIGNTACGNQVRRITTRTYSSRTASLYKGVAAFLRDSLAPTNIAVSGTYYAATNAAVQYAIAVANISLVPDPYLFYIGGTGQLCTASQKYADGSNGITYVSCVRNGSPIFPPIWQAYQTVITGPITVYYLDVHEVWTFDLV